MKPWLLRWVKEIRERHPLKQGLKQIGEKLDSLEHGDSGKTSTKTRIETLKLRIDYVVDGNSGKTSTKTRIETSSRAACNEHHIHIRERHPLKQGLKL